MSYRSKGEKLIHGGQGTRGDFFEVRFVMGFQWWGGHRLASPEEKALMHPSLRNILSKDRWVAMPLKPMRTAAWLQSCWARGGDDESEGNITFLRSPISGRVDTRVMGIWELYILEPEWTWHGCHSVEEKCHCGDSLSPRAFMYAALHRDSQLASWDEWFWLWSFLPHLSGRWMTANFS